MRNIKAISIVFMIVLTCISCGSRNEGAVYSVAAGNESGSKVIYRYLDAMPENETVNRFPWFAVITWKYDGKDQDGMPKNENISEMNSFEDAIDVMLKATKCGTDVYVKTGSGKRDFAYYVSNPEEFSKNVNEATKNNTQLPIEININEDKSWSELSKLRSKITK